MAENNNNQTNSGFTSNIGEENSLGFTPPSNEGAGFTPPSFQPEPPKEDGIIGLSENEIKLIFSNAVLQGEDDEKEEKRRPSCRP